MKCAHNYSATVPAIDKELVSALCGNVEMRMKCPISKYDDVRITTCNGKFPVTDKEINNPWLLSSH